jgi:ABC transporter substrate binding protein
MTVRATGVARSRPYRPRMDRRRFLLNAVAGVLAAPLVVKAQQTGKVARVGWLGGGGGRPLSEQQELPTSKAFAEGLLEFGYVVGENLLVERRVVAPDKVERYPDLAARLVTQGVDVILAANPYSLAAAVAATKTIPIVGIDLESDPVAEGWAATLARPGRNLTGFFLDIPEMSSSVDDAPNRDRTFLRTRAVDWFPMPSAAVAAGPRCRDRSIAARSR